MGRSFLPAWKRKLCAAALAAAVLALVLAAVWYCTGVHILYPPERTAGAVVEAAKGDGYIELDPETSARLLSLLQTIQVRDRFVQKAPVIQGGSSVIYLRFPDGTNQAVNVQYDSPFRWSGGWLSFANFDSGDSPRLDQDTGWAAYPCTRASRESVEAFEDLFHSIPGMMPYGVIAE